MTSISDLIRKTTSQSEQQREERQAERTNLSQMRDAAFEVVTAEPDLYRKYLKMNFSVSYTHLTLPTIA